MNIYYKKRRWKIALFIIAMVTFPLMIWYSNSLMDKIADDERKKVTIWADAIRRKSEMITFTNDFFQKIAKEEEIHATHIAQAMNRLSNSDGKEDITFYLDFIADNETIPIIIVDENGKVTEIRNLDEEYKQKINTPEKLQKVIIEENYNQIPIHYYEDIYYSMYYKESIIYTQLRGVLQDIIQNFITEITDNAPSLPVIVTDSSQQNIIQYSNIDSSRVEEPNYLKNRVENMRSQNQPIQIMFGEHTYGYVFHEESTILRTLRFFPIIQLLLVAIYIIIGYLMFSFIRRSEQDQVWVGMSKETAHQLGTPLSSLMAWAEILESENIHPDIVKEINKDIQRLENIAQRFSKIGSTPNLEEENINTVTIDFLSYFQSRTSSKVIFVKEIPEQPIYTQMNKYLFEWVLENLCKNAVDAMNGVGTITVKIYEDKQSTYVEISDTGKGIETKRQKTIFEPGFTTKSRGWGLGLTLAKRIVNEYHRGKIEVKNSSTKGTTFRIKLKKQLAVGN